MCAYELCVGSKDDLKFFDSSKILNRTKLNNINKFIIAMSIGYSNNSKLQLNSHIPIFEFSKLNEEDKSLIFAVAISDSEDINIMNDEKKLFKIAEEYANAGIKFLSDMEKESLYGFEIEQFESLINKKYKNINKK